MRVVLLALVVLGVAVIGLAVEPAVAPGISCSASARASAGTNQDPTDPDVDAAPPECTVTP